MNDPKDDSTTWLDADRRFGVRIDADGQMTPDGPRVRAARLAVVGTDGTEIIIPADVTAAAAMELGTLLLAAAAMIDPQIVRQQLDRQRAEEVLLRHAQQHPPKVLH